MLGYQLLVKIKKAASETEQLITSGNQVQIWFIHQLKFFLAVYTNQTVSFSPDLDADGADCLKYYSVSNSAGTHKCVYVITDNKI